jgi:integrase
MVRLCDPRHTTVSFPLQEGVPVHVVSESVGHKSPKMTLDVYAHVLPEMQREATEPLGRVLFGG